MGYLYYVVASVLFYFAVAKFDEGNNAWGVALLVIGIYFLCQHDHEQTGQGGK
jgi:hypothetical protein